MFLKCKSIYTEVATGGVSVLRNLAKFRGTKGAPFFLLRAATDQSFAFNLPFLYELKHKVCLCKIVYGIFHF